MCSPSNYDHILLGSCWINISRSVLYCSKNIAFGKELMLCFGFNHALLFECISVFSQEEGDVKAAIFKLTKRE